MLNTIAYLCICVVKSMCASAAVCVHARASVCVCLCVSSLYVHMKPQLVSVADIGDGCQRVEGPVHGGPCRGVHVERNQTLDTSGPVRNGGNAYRPSPTIPEAPPLPWPWPPRWTSPAPVRSSSLWNQHQQCC